MLFRSDRKSTRLNSSHTIISYAVFCLKKKKKAVETERMMLMFGGRTDGRKDHRLILGFGDMKNARKALSPKHLLNRLVIFFFNDPAPPEIYPLSLHDALPISAFSPIPDASRQLPLQPPPLQREHRLYQ